MAGSRNGSLYSALLEKSAVGSLIAAVIWVVLGFAAANVSLFGQQAPFGAACCAAAGKKNALAAGTGAVLGYVFSRSSAGSLRYVAAVIIVFVMELVFERIKDSALLASALAAVSTAAVGTAFGVIGGGESYGVAVAVSESVLAGGGAYFFYMSRKIAEQKRPLGSLRSADRACLIVAASVMAAALGQVTFGRISLGRIAACYIVLLAARFGRESAGTVAGVAAGAAVGFAASGTRWLIGAYGFGGLMAGVFSVFGRVGAASAYVLVQLLGVLLESGEYPDFAPVYEAVAASGLLLVTPSRLAGMKALWAPKEEMGADSATVKSLLLQRLKRASSGLANVADMTKKVSSTLAQSASPDMGAVFAKAADKVCASCPMSTVCWNENYTSTTKAFTDMSTVLKGGGTVSEGSWPQAFAQRCRKTEELSAAINRNWEAAVSNRCVKNKVSQVREVVADQFEGLSEMLSDLGSEMEGVMQVDRKLTAAVKNWLENAGMAPLSVVCWCDDGARMNISAEVPDFKLERVDEDSLRMELSELCGCDLCEPVIVREDRSARIVLYDKPTLTVEFGKAERPAEGEAHCGDNADSFVDERGAAHMLLSDGMGSGNAAALDSAMTVGLLAGMLRAGFRFGSALRLVNSALLVKSGEESIATADAAEVDLYSGETVFYKAGAAPSFVLRGGAVTKVEAMSLPAGILGGVSYEESCLSLSSGDIILIMSDGATASGEDWIPSELRAAAGLPPEEIASHIADTALARRSDGHGDDITVIAAKLGDGI